MKYSLPATAAVGLSLLIAQPAFADAETEALKKEVKALEARIAQLEKKEAQDKKNQQAQTQQAPAATGNNTGNASIEKRLAIVERKQEVTQEYTNAKDAVTPKFSYTPARGLVLATPDNQYALRVSGYVQADDRSFLNPNNKDGNTDTFLIRSARPVVEAKLTDYFDSRFMVDFGKGSTTLLDAYGDFHPMPGSDLFSLRAGEFKLPIGIERWQSESDVLFVERGQTTNLVPYRDTGIMAHGQLIPDQLEYEAGLTNGAVDLATPTNTGDTDNNKDVMGRIFVHPLTWSGIEALSGLGVGIGGTYGKHQGGVAAGASGLTTGYATFGQRTFFTYRATSFANGPQRRINPQLTYYYGPLGIMGEYVADTQEVKNGTHDMNLRNNAWEGVASYVLTGEDASFDGVTPAHNFDPRSNQWGAFELVGRVSQLDVDRNAFGTYADPSVSARSAFETTLGGTWYFSRAVKFNLDFSRTTFEGGALGNYDHQDERAVLSRVQLRF